MALSTASKKSLLLLALFAAACFAPAFAAQSRAAAGSLPGAAEVAAEGVGAAAAGDSASAAAASREDADLAAPPAKGLSKQKKAALVGGSALLAALMLVGVGLYFAQEKPEEAARTEAPLITVKDVSEEEFHKKVIDLLFRQTYNFKVHVGERVIHFKFEDTDFLPGYLKSLGRAELAKVQKEQTDMLEGYMHIEDSSERKWLATMSFGDDSITLRAEDVTEAKATLDDVEEEDSEA